MHRLGCQILTRTGRTCDQNGQIGGRYHANGLEYPLHPGAFAHQVFKNSLPAADLLKTAVFPNKSASFQGFFQSEDESFMLKWFGDEIVGTLLHGLYSHFHVAIGCHHYDGEFRMLLLYNLQELKTAHNRHFNIGQEEVIGVSGQHLDGRLCGRCSIHMTLQIGCEAPLQEVEHIGFVIYN